MRPASDDTDTLATALDALPIGIMVFDHAARLRYASPGVSRNTGIEPHLLRPGATTLEIARLLAFRGDYGPGDPEAQAAAVLAIDRRRPHRRLTRTKAGRSLEVSSAPTADGGFISWAVDVSAYVNATAAAEGRCRLLDGVLHDLRSGIALFDGEQRLVLHNPAYRRLIGAPPGLLRDGMTLAELLAALAARGEFANLGDTEYPAARLSLDHTLPQVLQRERPDGTVVRAITTPRAGGGFLLENADVTAMQRAEDEARHRAALLDGAMAALPYGVCMYGADHRVTLVNEAYNRIMTGAPVRVGETLRQIVERRHAAGEYGGDDIDTVIRRQLDFGAGSRDRVRVRRAGNVIAIRTARLPDGGHLSLVSDITALHRAEAAAAGRAAVVQTMLDHMRHGLYLFDRDRRLVAGNHLAARLTGLPPEVLTPGMTLEDIRRRQIASGEFGNAPEEHQRRLEEVGYDRSKPHRYTRTRPDGSVIEVASDPTPDGGFVISFADVTPLARAEAEAKRRAAVQETMLETTRHGIALFDAERRIVAANRLCAVFCGIPIEALAPGRTIESIIAEQVAAGEFGDAEQTADFLARTEWLDRNRPARHRRRRPDGTLLEVQTDPTPDGGFVITISDITALTRAEAAAEERAAVLRAMLDNSRHGICLFDSEHRLVAANRLAARLMGIDEAVLRPGTDSHDIIAAQAAAGAFGPPEAAAPVLRQVLARDRSRPARYHRTTPEGVVLDVASDPLPDGGFVISFSDVTPLMQAEAEARRRAAQAQAMLDTMRHGIVLVDAGNRVVAANALAAEYTGLTVAELCPGALMTELRRLQFERGEFGTGPEAEAFCAERQARPPGTAERYVRRRPTGQLIEVITDRTPDGGFVRTYTDVTETHRNRAALEQAEEETRRRAAVQRAMLDNIRHGVVLFDRDGRLIAANALAAQLTLIPAEHLTPGRHVHELVAEQARRGYFRPGEVEQALSQLPADDDWPAPHRFVRHRADGRVLEIATDRTPDGGYIRTYSDVTDTVRTREELERARDAAEEASRAKSRFLATMSHELRTPLNAVIGFSEALLNQSAPEPFNEYAHTIHAAGRQLLALIDDILEVARADTTAFRPGDAPVELDALAQAVLRTARGAGLPPGVTLRAEIGDGLPRIAGDERRLRQVLGSLLSNAIKFTPAGGEVLLRAAAAPDGAVAVAVVDHGVGMAPEDIPRAFEPFTQLDGAAARQFQGSGLGLHLARTLARAMGMALTLDSRPGQGTTATLTIPPDRLVAGVPGAK